MTDANEPKRSDIEGIVPEHEVDEYMDGLLEQARMAQTERASGAPVQVSIGTPDETNEKLWPYTTVYFLPEGTVETRNHSIESGGSTILAHQAFLVLRLKHSVPPVMPSIEVMKFRGDLKDFMTSLVEAFMKSPSNIDEHSAELLKQLHLNEGH